MRPEWGNSEAKWKIGWQKESETRKWRDWVKKTSKASERRGLTWTLPAPERVSEVDRGMEREVKLTHHTHQLLWTEVDAWMTHRATHFIRSYTCPCTHSTRGIQGIQWFLSITKRLQDPCLCHCVLRPTTNWCKMHKWIKPAMNARYQQLLSVEPNPDASYFSELHCRLKSHINISMSHTGFLHSKDQGAVVYFEMIPHIQSCCCKYPLVHQIRVPK